MALRVIGAGLGRTGTLSLKGALERLLGAPCYHMFEAVQHPEHVARWRAAARGELPDWDRLFDGFAAAVDWPASAFWRELSEAYPDAPIVLSTRSAESWWASASQTIFAVQDRVADERADMIRELLAARFTSAISDRAAAIAAFEAHNADVRANAPRHRLIDWTPEDGWAPLCEALGVAVPDEPFPRVNTREEFVANVRGGDPGPRS